MEVKDLKNEAPKSEKPKSEKPKLQESQDQTQRKLNKYKNIKFPKL